MKLGSPPPSVFRSLEKGEGDIYSAENYPYRDDEDVSRMLAFLYANRNRMTDYEKAAFSEAMKIKALGKPSPYIPTVPSEYQRRFLTTDCQEAMYGGAAGGGKSEALLMGALQYVDVPGYSALILRRTYKELALPGALMDRARQWLTRPDLPKEIAPRWQGQSYSWVFPSGAKLTFGYLESNSDTGQYQSAEFQYIGFDELTQFHESMYTYMFSRNRKKSGVNVPLRIRSATNPGSIGHEWVKRRFIPDAYSRASAEERFSRPWTNKAGRIFFPARLEHNPGVDKESYEKSLSELDPVTHAQLANGDWEVVGSGNLFKTDWFRRFNFMRESNTLMFLPKHSETFQELPGFRVGFSDILYRFVTADTANKKHDHADFTAIAAWGVGTIQGRNTLILMDMQRERIEVPDLHVEIDKMAERWDCDEVIVEDNSSGIGVLQTLKRMKKPYKVTDFRPGSADKVLRSSLAQNILKDGRMYINYQNKWYGDYVNELLQFPDGLFDDQVDVTSMAAWRFRQFDNPNSSAIVPLPLPAERHPLLGSLSFG